MSRPYTRGDKIADRWEIFDVMHGGMGIVYACADLASPGFSVALKTLKPEHARRRSICKRFVREALVWIGLRGAPHVVQVSVVETVDGQPYLVMEYVEYSLKEVIHPTETRTAPLRWGAPPPPTWNLLYGRRDWKTWLLCAMQVAEGMEFVTRKMPGLVHRDIKPSNILLNMWGESKVADFGLVAVFDGAHVDREPSGTAPYMSPEQWRGDFLDARSDIYAFGCVLYEMLTGHLVFPASSSDQWRRHHSSQTPISPAKLVHSMPPELEGLVLRCLEKNPANRYSNWTSLADAIATVSGETRSGPPQALDVSFEITARKKNAVVEQLEERARALGTIDESVEPPAEWTPVEEERRFVLMEAMSLMRLGKYDVALQRWDRLLEITPESESAEILVNKGATLSNNFALHEEGLLCFNRALKLNPRLAIAWRNKGVVLDIMGRFEEAAGCSGRALALGARGARTRMWKSRLKFWIQKLFFVRPTKKLARSLEESPAFVESLAVLEEAERLFAGSESPLPVMDFMKSEKFLSMPRNIIGPGGSLHPRYLVLMHEIGLRCRVLGQLDGRARDTPFATD